MSSVNDHFDYYWFLHYVQENTMKFGRAREASGRPFRCPHYFHSVFFHGVVKLSFSNKFIPLMMASIRLLKIVCIHSWCGTVQTGLFPCSLLSRLPWLDKTFCIVLQRFIPLQIPSLSFWLWALSTTVVSRKEQGDQLKRSFQKVFSQLLTLL